MTLSKLFHRCVQTLSFLSLSIAAAPPPESLEALGGHARSRSLNAPDATGNGPTAPRKTRYVEIADGLNYQTPGGQWLPSAPVFAKTNGWAIASQCQHKAAIFLQLRRSGGVTLTLPGGAALRSHVVGISYFDTATGDSVLVAEPVERQGEIINGSQVVFHDAFDDIDADLRYVMSLRGFEQDVIFRSALPSPASFGLNPETTQVEVLTEFVQYPEPRISRRSIPHASSASEVDQGLDFGSMQASLGTAYNIGSPSSPLAFVRKQWMKLGPRQFLVEALPFEVVAAQLPSTPHEEALRQRPRNRSAVHQQGLNALARAFGPEHRPTPETDSWQSASESGSHSGPTTMPPRQRADSMGRAAKGVVLDYSLTLSPSTTAMRFRADTTYYISGTVTAFGAIFEGGTVLKYAPGCSLMVEYAVSEETSLHRPVHFTAATDDTVGDPINLGTNTYPRPMPTGYFGAPCLWIRGAGSGSFYPCNLDASNFRFAHASIALRLHGGSTQTLRHTQFRDCGTAIELLSVANPIQDVSLHNLLFTRCGNAVATSGPWLNIQGQHLTFNTVEKVRSGTSPGNFQFRNCLLANVQQTSGFEFPASQGNLVVTQPETVLSRMLGAGSYIQASSPWILSSPTNGIHPRLIQELQECTTQAPQRLSGRVRGTTQLRPTLPQKRAPHKLTPGYHYPRLDYVLTDLLIEQGTLEVNGGVALAAAQPQGMQLGSGAGLHFKGEPYSPITFAKVQTIQEGPMPQETSPSRSMDEWLVRSVSGTFIPPRLTAAYTTFLVPAGTGGILEGRDSLEALHLKHVQAFGGSVSVGPAALESQTVAMDTVAFQGAALVLNTASNNMTTQIRGGTFRESRMQFIGFTNQPAAISDSILSEVEATWSTAGIRIENTAFHKSTNVSSAGVRLPFSNISLPPGSNLFLNGILWAKGPFGFSYYTTTALRDRGSTNASALGLYHHTTSPTQEKELNSRIDLGFHYPAASGSAPLDSDGDGLTDLDEDSDGNGLLGPLLPAAAGARKETDFTRVDTDNDGLDDGLEWRRGTNPRIAEPGAEWLTASWDFNRAGFNSDQEDVPVPGILAAKDAVSWDGTALQLTTIGATPSTPKQYSWVAYDWKRADDSCLLSPLRGTLQFWFKPNWTSRAALPAEDGVTTSRNWVVIQAQGDDSEVWGLRLNPSGNLATFSILRAGSTVAKTMTWAVNLERGIWAHWAVTYDTSGIALWKNGQRLTPTGAAIAAESWPADNTRPKRVYFGGWELTGLPRPANGTYESIQFHNQPLSAQALERTYRDVLGRDSDGDGLPDLLEFRLSGFSASKADSDNDALPDTWEYDFFGNNQATPLADPDGDGSSNIDEYIQGRNPKVADARWSVVKLQQSVRNPSDLINIDFAPATRLPGDGTILTRLGAALIEPVAASLDSATSKRRADTDVWNIVTPAALRSMDAAAAGTTIHNAQGAPTLVRLTALYGPVLYWSGGSCSSNAASIGRADSAIPTGRNAALAAVAPPSATDPADIQNWCSLNRVLSPTVPNLGTSPLPAPKFQPDLPYIPPWRWFANVPWRLILDCPASGSSPTPITTAVRPLDGTQALDSPLFPFPNPDDSLPTAGYPPCLGTPRWVFRPAFQEWSAFTLRPTDTAAPTVLLHRPFQDYLYCPEESPEVRARMERAGFDLRYARSFLHVSGLSQGVWRVLLYAAPDQDSASLPIRFLTSAKPDVASIPEAFVERDGANGQGVGLVLDGLEWTNTWIHPGIRRTPQFMESRHYVQQTLEIGPSGYLGIEFPANGVINSLQFLRVGSMEPPQWERPIEDNPALGLILRWKEVPTALGYTLQRATNSAGPFADFVTLGPVTAFRDSQAGPQANGQPQTFWYRIRAHNELGTSLSTAAAGTRTAATLGNKPPVLSRIGLLGPAYDTDLFPIGLADLRWRAATSDAEGEPLRFRIERIVNGSLYVRGIPITAEQLAAANATNGSLGMIQGESEIAWRSANGSPGIVHALDVRAFDGTQFSDQDAPLQISVKAPNQIVWWGSSLLETAGNGQPVDTLKLEAKYPGRRRYVQYDPEYWAAAPVAIHGPDSGRFLNAAQLVAKEGCSLALKGDGTIWSWGRLDARLGRGSAVCPANTPGCDLPWFVSTNSLVPQRVSFDSDGRRFRQIAISSSLAAAVSTDGQVFLWGTDPPLSEGFSEQSTVALGILPRESVITATTVGPYDPSDTEERINAQRFAVPGTGVPTRVPNLNGAHQVACSDHAVAVLLQDGSVVDWGTLTYFDSREVRSGPGGSISSQGAYRRLLNSSSPTPRYLPAKAIALAAGANFFLALTADGEVFAWGANDTGGFADPAWSFDITQPATVGTLIPRRVPGLSQVLSIDASDAHAVARLQSGAVLEWGRSLTSVLTLQPPRTVLDLPPVLGALSTPFAGFAIDGDGMAWGWGHNGEFGSAPEYATPTGVLAPSSRSAVQASPRPITSLQSVQTLSSPGRFTIHALAAPLPLSPQGLRAVYETNWIRLKWTHMPGAREYRIYKSTHPLSGFDWVGTWTEDGFTPIEWLDRSIALDQTYYYRVTALLQGVETPASVVTWVRTESAPPSVAGLVISPKARALHLTWCPSARALDYEILRAGPFEIQPSGIPQSAYTTRFVLETATALPDPASTPDCVANKPRLLDSDLQPSKWYAYKIRARNAAGVSANLETSQRVPTTQAGPTPPTIASLTQDGTSVMIQFQTNHAAVETQWLIRIHRLQLSATSGACIDSIGTTEPSWQDPRWQLDRVVTLPDLVGASAGRMALSRMPGSPQRLLFIDGVPAGVWHKVSLIAVTEHGLSSEPMSVVGSGRIYRTINPAATRPELLTARSGPGYIYVRYRTDAGFAPTRLNPKPLSCTNSAIFEPGSCLQFTGYPEEASGESESWILNLQPLPSQRPYHLSVLPGSSAAAQQGIERDFIVEPRATIDAFEIRTTLGIGRVRLDWAAEEMSTRFPERKYVVERLDANPATGLLPDPCDPTIPWKPLAEGSGLRFEDASVVEGNLYQYRVLALNPGTGELDWVTTPPIRATAPLTQTQQAQFLTSWNATAFNGAVELTWRSIELAPSANNARHYTVLHFASANGMGEVIAEFSDKPNPATGTSPTWRWIHTPLPNGSTHYYQLIADLDNLTRIESPVLKASPSASLAPMPPQDIVVRRIQGGTPPLRYTLQWEPSEGAVAYSVVARVQGSTQCLGQWTVSRTHTEFVPDQLPSNAAIEFRILPIAATTAQTPSNACASGGFAPATVFGPVARNTPRASWDAAEYVQLVLPNLGTNVVPVIQTPTNLTLRASVAFSGAQVREVEFFCNDEHIGTGTSPLFAHTWINPPASGIRPHKLVAVALLADGRNVASTERELQIRLRPPASGFDLEFTDFSLRAAGNTFELKHAYHSGDASGGILGLGWTFNFERAQLICPDLASGWQVIGTGLGNLFATVQDAGAAHEVAVTLPEGITLRFAAVPRFQEGVLKRDTEWIEVADDPEWGSNQVQMDFMALDGSGASLETLDTSESLGIDFTSNTLVDGNKIVSCVLKQGDAAYKPTRFKLTLPTGQRFLFAGQSSQVPDGTRSLRLTEAVDPYGNRVRIQVQNATRAEITEGPYSLVTARRIAIQCLQPEGEILRECWLDRLETSPPTWQLFDPVAIQFAKTAARTNPAAVLPGSMAAAPLMRFVRNANRLESSSVLRSRESGSYETNRFEYTAYPGDPSQSSSSRELLTAVSDAEGRETIRNTYQWFNGQFVLRSQQSANGSLRTYAYAQTNQVTATVSGSDGSLGTERILYNNQGELSEVVDATGVRQLTLRDDRGRPTFEGTLSATADGPQQTTVARRFDDDDNPIEESNGAGAVTRRDYDGIGRLISTVDPLGNRTAIQHGNNDVRGTSSPGSRTRTITDALGTTTEHVFNDRGQLLSTTVRAADRTPVVTRYEYFESMEPNGCIGDLRRIHYPLSTASQSPASPFGTTPALHTVEYTYDANGNQTGESRLRRIRVVETNNLGSRVEIERLEQALKQQKYSPQNRIVESTLTSALVNPMGIVLSGTETGMDRTTTLFDSSGQVVQTRNALGHPTTSLFDVSGNLIQTTFPDGSTVRTVFDGLGRQKLVQERTRPSITATATEPALGTTLGPAQEFIYDSAGRVVQIRNRSAVTLRIAEDTRYRGYKAGNPKQYLCVNETPATVWNTNGVTVARTVYDSLGRTRYQVGPLGGLTETIYDAAGQVALTLRYDSQSFSLEGGPIVTTGVKASRSSNGYDAAGNLIWSLGPLYPTNGIYAEDDRLKTIHEYDALNRKVRTSLPVHRGTRATHETRYDAEGRPILEIDAEGRQTRSVFDVQGRLVQLIPNWNPALPETTQVGSTVYAYDEFNNLIRITDALGRTTRYEYDALGRRTHRILPGGSMLSSSTSGDLERFQFSPMPNLPSANAPNSITHHRVGGGTLERRFDSTGRVIEILATPATAASPTVRLVMEYTEWGAPLRIREFRGSPLPATPTRLTELGYYAATRRLATRATPEGTLAYVWNASGVVSRIQANLGALFLTGTAYDYDPHGRLTLVRQLSSTTDTTGLPTARYEYTASDAPSQTLLGGNLITQFDYSPRGLLTRITARRGTTNGAPEIALLDYDPADNPMDSLGRRRAVAERFAGISVSGGVAPGGIRSRRVDYRFDDQRRLVGEEARAESPATQSMLGTAGSVQYTLDAVGNRIQRTSTASWQSLLPSTGPLPYDDLDRASPYTNPQVRSSWFDAAGNEQRTVLSGTTSSATGDSFDVFGRLVRHQSAGSSTVAEYDYDEDGNRIARRLISGGSTNETRYLTERHTPTGYAEVIAEWNIASSRTNLGRIYQVGRERVLQQDGADPTTRRLFVRDALGSTRVLADWDGLPRHLFLYDAHGKLIGRSDWGGVGTTNASWATVTPGTAPLPTAYLFGGQFWDESLGLAYHRARYYDPNQGRFRSPDPSEGTYYESLSRHKYLYAHGDPLNLEDPSGESALGDLMFSIAGRATLAMKSTGPIATGIRAAFTLLTFASAVHDPAGFAACFESPYAAARIVALDASFLMYYGRRSYQFLSGYIALKQDIVPKMEKVLAASAERVKQIDPNAIVGYRGSAARGYKGAHKNNDPFNPEQFDVDGFVLSDRLAEKIPKHRGARFAEAETVPELAMEQQRVDSELRSQLDGLKKQPFSFRVFTFREFTKLYKDSNLVDP